MLPDPLVTPELRAIFPPPNIHCFGEEICFHCTSLGMSTGVQTALWKCSSFFVGGTSLWWIVYEECSFAMWLEQPPAFEEVVCLSAELQTAA